MHSRLAQLATGLVGYFRWDATGMTWDSTASLWLGGCPSGETLVEHPLEGATAPGIRVGWWGDPLVRDALDRARNEPGRVVSWVIPGVIDAEDAQPGLALEEGVPPGALERCRKSAFIVMRGRWQAGAFEAVVMPVPGGEGTEGICALAAEPAMAPGTNHGFAPPDDLLAAAEPVSDMEERVGRVCHELRTPLQALMGHCELAAQDWPAQVNAQHLTRITQAGQRMLHIVNDLVDLTRVELGTLEIQHDQPLALRAQLARTLLMAEGLRRTCPVGLYVSVDPACPEALRGDGARLEQILLNLLSNAIRFTDQGEILLQVRLLRRTVDAVSLRVTVADSGIGLPADELARLKAFAGRTLPWPRRGGSGFGLAVVRGLLELHGATLEIASAQGGGTLMWFDLTYLMDAEGDNGPEATRHAVGASEASGHPVWVFSQDERLVETLAVMCHGQGQLTRQGEQAWQASASASASAKVAPLWLVDAAWPLAEQAVAQAETRGVRLLCVQAQPAPLGTMLAGHPVHPMIRAWELLFPPHAGRALQEDPVLAGRRVLVIEDELLNQAVVLEALQQLGMQASLCAQGQEGVNLMRQQHWDAVLLDMHLPDMDGVQVLRAWQVLPEAARAPVALVSAHVTETEWLQAQQLGVRHRLIKPYALSDLGVLLRSLCADRPRWPAADAPPTQAPPELALLPRLPEPGVPRDRWLRQVFLQEWPRLRTAVVQSLRPLSEAGYEPAALRQSVHALRGALAMMGRGPLLDQARHLEEQILAGVSVPEVDVRSFLSLVEERCTQPERTPTAS
jgi:signal transduction histidine kinase/ActR/RegA family two-component response regulator